MSDGPNHRRKDRKRKGEKPPHCECPCHRVIVDYTHRKPCCYPKAIWWILSQEDNEEVWVPCEPL